MSLGSRLRVRREMGVHGLEEDEEAAYLLTPSADEDKSLQAKQHRRRRNFSTFRCSRRTLIILLSIACFASLAGLLISSSVSVVPRSFALPPAEFCTQFPEPAAPRMCRHAKEGLSMPASDVPTLGPVFTLLYCTIQDTRRSTARL